MAKRRLPLLQAAPEEGEPPRSRWQWVLFGAAAIFAAWTLLSIVAGAVAERLLSGFTDPKTVRLAAMVSSSMFAAELAAGALAGGYLVGRWGPKTVGVREGAFSGVAAAGGVGIVIWAAFGLTPGLLLLVAMAPAAAAWGARIGERRRARGGLPPLE